MNKKTHAEVNYGRGSPLRNCGLCLRYRGGSCVAVQGPITPYGDCDIHKFPKNPWGSTLTKAEMAAIERMMLK